MWMEITKLSKLTSAWFIVAGADSVITANAANISTVIICVADFVSIITFIIYKIWNQKERKNYVIFMILDCDEKSCGKVKLHEIMR